MLFEAVVYQYYDHFLIFFPKYRLINISSKDHSVILIYHLNFLIVIIYLSNIAFNQI
jgi:hypothetical protein